MLQPTFLDYLEFFWFACLLFQRLLRSVSTLIAVAVAACKNFWHDLFQFVTFFFLDLLNHLEVGT